MAFLDEMKAVIDKNLPAELGTALKTRLQYAEEDAERVKMLTKKMADLESKIAFLEDERRAHTALDKRQTQLDEREKAVGYLEMRKEMLVLQQKICDTRVADMKEIVLAVFANNHFKYMLSEGGQVPFAGAPGSYPQSAPFSRTVTGEGTGAPPPPPSTTPIGG